MYSNNWNLRYVHISSVCGCGVTFLFPNLVLCMDRTESEFFISSVGLGLCLFVKFKLHSMEYLKKIGAQWGSPNYKSHINRLQRVRKALSQLSSLLSCFFRLPICFLSLASSMTPLSNTFNRHLNIWVLNAVRGCNLISRSQFQSTSIDCRLIRSLN